ncbi:hypothetical protein B0T21DRAFT_452948 [Apiosordaria backusii]|uniref:Conidiation-specific protein 13 n=1 Tax=Apiosordaria backusii TaxID=314023 RepID=A0AA40B275_9PEZI|nr:hypothetical protein B0T21DRAFT_452948 [Apiosordaria backusii]
MLFNTAQLVAGLLLAGEATAQLTKPLINPPFGELGPVLQSRLRTPQYTVNKWPWGLIPLRCRAVAEQENYTPYDIEVYDVTYSDCPTKWVLCRHNQSPTSPAQFFDRVGRLPVGFRDYLRHFILLPSRGATHAYTYSDLGDAIILGDGHGSNAQTLYVHEIAHTVDWHHNRASTTQGWLNAYNAASAVSDDYARRNQAENFAQETVIAMYDSVVTPNGIPGVNSGWQQIAPMYQYIKNLLGDKIQRIDSKVCTRNVGIPLWDTTVCMGPAARDSGNCPGVSARDLERTQGGYNETVTENPEALVK